MKRSFSGILVCLLALTLIVPSFALAEGYVLPDASAFAGELLSGCTVQDFDFCIQRMYLGCEEDIATVAVAYTDLLKQSYGMEEIFQYEADTGDGDTRFDYAYTTQEEHPELEDFGMDDPVYGYHVEACKLFITYSQTAGSSENFLQITHSIGFVYQDTGDRLNGDAFQEATAVPETAHAPAVEPTPDPDCAICHGDRICDTCGGAGYHMMTLHNSNEPVQIACSAGCNIGSCPACIIACGNCTSDGLCNSCGGLGHTTAQGADAEAPEKSVCTAESCRQGFCALCMPEWEDRFALVAVEPEVTLTPTPAPTPKPTPSPTKKPEPTRTPKPTPTLVPSGQAVIGKSTQIADLALFSNRQLYSSYQRLSDDHLNADYFRFAPTDSFQGSLRSIAEDYADSLADSGYYTLSKESSYDGYNYWFLQYINASSIEPCDDVLLEGADICICIPRSNDELLLWVNPSITFFK